MRLFLDDERFPPNNETDWIVVRSTEEASAYIARMGMPKFISFDHDLGQGQKTGFDLAKWIVEYDIVHDIWRNRSDFGYYVHSQNPVGKINIEKYLENYLDFKFRNAIH